jgi:hypothetical protein
MDLLPRIAWVLRDKRLLIWTLSTVGFVVGVWGQLKVLRGEVPPSIGITYLGFLVAAVGGALHSIAFWFAPGRDGKRSRFERLAAFLRFYPFLEVSLSLMWLTALLVNGWIVVKKMGEAPAVAASAGSAGPAQRPRMPRP